MSHFNPSQTSYRGRGRGDSRGRGGFRAYPFLPPVSSPATEPLSPDKDLLDGISEPPITTIDIPASTEIQTDDDVEIRSCKYLGSYNWLNKRKPTLVTPGCPPIWTERRLPFHVPPDEGSMYVDQNGYRVPGRSLLPLFIVVNKRREDAGKSAFSWSKLDFVSDRNGLRKLLRWIGGTVNRGFRIDLQLAGTKTVLLNRWERRLKEQLSGRTYGFNFEAAATREAPDCKGSSSHHRIITYSLNGLRLAVRFEVDACLEPNTKAQSSNRTTSPASTSSNTSPARSVAQSDIDTLTASFQRSVTLASTAPIDTPDPLDAEEIHGITILNGGREIKSEDLVEMTTRAERTLARYPFDWDEAYPQLWLSQTMNHKLAMQSWGKFTEIQERKLSSKARKDQQPQFKKFRRALDIIQAIVIEHGKEGRLSLVCDEDGVMKVYKRSDSASCLPDDILAIFDRKTEAATE